MLTQKDISIVCKPSGWWFLFNKVSNEFIDTPPLGTEKEAKKARIEFIRDLAQFMNDTASEKL